MTSPSPASDARIDTHITDQPLPPLEADDSQQELGAELIFHGRVRGSEDGRAIVALEYERYEGLAEKELERVARDAAQRFPIDRLVCWHRVGRVEVGEASMRVVVWSCHRREGLQAMDWFISALKQRVPFWKWAVTADGERFPSTCGHHEEEHDHSPADS